MSTSRGIRRAYNVRLRSLGLNLSEAIFLSFVGEQGPTSQSAIAKRVGMGRASAGSLIDGLVQRGLLYRAARPGDRRVWMVAITSSGRDCVELINSVDQELREELRKGISRTDRRQLAATLVRLQNNVDRLLDSE